MHLQKIVDGRREPYCGSASTSHGVSPDIGHTTCVACLDALESSGVAVDFMSAGAVARRRRAIAAGRMQMLRDITIHPGDDEDASVRTYIEPVPQR